MSKKAPVVGDLISVDIYPPKKGTFPIGKYGPIFCKLFILKSVGRIHPGDTCLAEVTEVQKNFLNVKVIEVLRTAAVNNYNMQMKLKTVKAIDQSKDKVKKNYPLAEALEKAAAKKFK
jgi:hypothetical protein